MKQKQKTVPELLAPAGSLESFNAALEAGADAVYLGVGELNARLRARNFTMDSLAHLIGIANNCHVKIYVTLNTLIKQGELRSVLDLLFQLKQLKIDAVIVQDLGLAHLAHKYFPKLTLHASTQMVIHNKMGLDAAQNLGIKRAVLSRELSIEEIMLLQRESSVELEVFIHGALCYAISGLCLASSYLGGWSGNRGRCTQVCRRKFSSEHTSGYTFSPGDLWAVDHITDLSKIGISSLKIEGRMKRAEYVFTVVSAYRKLLDGKISVEEAKAGLTMDLAREKTSFFLKSPKQRDIIKSDRGSGTGIPLGKLESLSGNLLRVRTKLEIRPDDTLRLQDVNGDEHSVFTVEKVEKKRGIAEITAQAKITGNINDQLYLVSRKLNKSSHWKRKKVDSVTKFKKYHKRYPNHQKVLNSFCAPKISDAGREKRYLKIDNPGWLPILKSFKFDLLILTGNSSFHADIIKKPKQLNYWKDKLVIEFPPFISETVMESYQQVVSDYSKLGVQRWMSSHFGQMGMFPKGEMCIADSMVWTTNRACQDFLVTSGYNQFTYSLEDDLLNIKANASISGIMPIFGHVPLFISKIRPATQDVKINAGKENFTIVEKDDLFYTISEQPVCLFHRQEKLKGLGINQFLIDLSFITPSRKRFKTLVFEFTAGQRLSNTSIFNHKTGLK